MEPDPLEELASITDTRRVSPHRPRPPSAGGAWQSRAWSLYQTGLWAGLGFFTAAIAFYFVLDAIIGWQFRRSLRGLPF